MAEENSKDPKDPKDDGKITAGTLRSMIREEVAGIAKNLIPGGSKDDGGDDNKDTGNPADIRGQVEKALTSLREREARQERDKKVDELLEKSAAPKEEKPPVERSRLHRFMGWGEPSE